MFQWNYGVFSSTASSLVTTHLKVATGKVGINLNVFGPNPVAHLLGGKFIRIAGEHMHY
jgi:membrane-associated protease RseP (regulator of RpoE activity)